MEVLTKSESDKLIASLEGRPILFAKSVNISKSSDTQENYADEQDKPWPTSFSLTATMDSTEISSIHIRKLLGLYRPKRGSSRNATQKIHRTIHYLRKTDELPIRQRTWTLADQRWYKNIQLK